MSQNTFTPEIAQKRLSDIFGIEITRELAEQAIAMLDTYEDGIFETLQVRYKVKGTTYILLAVQNTEMHNGAWQRYIDYLQSKYETIVVESIINASLMHWFLNNGFKQTRKHKDWAIWRKPV